MGCGFSYSENRIFEIIGNIAITLQTTQEQRLRYHDVAPITDMNSEMHFQDVLSEGIDEIHRIVHDQLSIRSRLILEFERLVARLRQTHPLLCIKYQSELEDIIAVMEQKANKRKTKGGASSSVSLHNSSFTTPKRRCTHYDKDDYISGSTTYNAQLQYNGNLANSCSSNYTDRVYSRGNEQCRERGINSRLCSSLSSENTCHLPLHKRSPAHGPYFNNNYTNNINIHSNGMCDDMYFELCKAETRDYNHRSGGAAGDEMDLGIDVEAANSGMDTACTSPDNSCKYRRPADNRQAMDMFSTFDDKGQDMRQDMSQDQDEEDVIFIDIEKYNKLNNSKHTAKSKSSHHYPLKNKQPQYNNNHTNNHTTNHNYNNNQSSNNSRRSSSIDTDVLVFSQTYNNHNAHNNYHNCDDHDYSSHGAAPTQHTAKGDDNHMDREKDKVTPPRLKSLFYSNKHNSSSDSCDTMGDFGFFDHETDQACVQY